MGKNKKAIQYYNRAIQIRTKLFGNDNATVADAYCNRAIAFIDMNDYISAIQSYNEAIQIRIYNYSVADIYCDMAVLYESNNELANAARCRNEVIQIKIKLLGKNNVTIADAYYNLAKVYRNIKNQTKAIEYYNEVIRIKSKLLGSKNSDVAKLYFLMGIALEGMNDKRKAFYCFCRYAVLCLKCGAYDMMCNSFKKIIRLSDKESKKAILSEFYIAAYKIYGKNADFTKSIQQNYRTEISN